MNGQLSLGEETNKGLLDVILPPLLDVIQADNLHTEDLKTILHEPEKGEKYVSIKYSTSLLCRIYQSRVEIPIGLDPDGKRLKFKDSTELQHIIPRLTAALDRLLENLSIEFDCCSRYEQCSDALRCIHPDPQMAVKCRYRRILKSGKVFYGKNAAQVSGLDTPV